MSYVFVVKFARDYWVILAWILGLFLSWVLTGMLLVYLWFRCSVHDDEL